MFIVAVIMRKVFWDDPYQTQLETQVVTVEGSRVLFAATIAFSFSGGQESDKAYANGFPVISSVMVGPLIYYLFPEEHTLSPGDWVTMSIDWPRRYRLMRLHFAAELILELVTQKLALERIGAHIAETKARIDFVYDKNISCLFPELLTHYAAIIKKNEPIKTGFSDVQMQRRFWEVSGFSKVACGGTHVKATGEVGLVSLKRVNIGNYKERIEIKLLDDDFS